MGLQFHQVVLNSPVAFTSPTLLNDASLLSPIFVTGLSLVIISVQAIYAAFSASKRSNGHKTDTSVSSFSKHVTEVGGLAIFVFKITRFLACLALFGLAVPSTFLVKGGLHEGSVGFVGKFDTLRDGVCAVFLYASILGLVSVAGSPRWSRVSTSHLVLVLLAPWALYVYRNVWPLCTFTSSPKDAADDALVWAKIALLTLAAAVIPISIPRHHIPVDLGDIPKEIPLTDTASLFSMITHSYSDSVVYKANKADHVKLDELPPLSDKDYTKNLAKKSFRNLDPLLKKRYIGLSLIFFVFPQEHVELAAILILRVFVSFLGPLGIYQLLNYIETGGENAIVCPWVWITWLILGPSLGSIVFEWYHYRTTRMFVQSQSIITQLIFDHALRMRVKSDVPKSTDTIEQGAPPPTPDNASVAGLSAGTNETTNNGDNASIATSATKAQAAKVKTNTESHNSKEASSNLVGKLTNLVTTDLATLQGGQSFMMLIFYVPIQIVFSMVILHSMLGWSVYPGLAVMAIMLPVPGYVAKLLRGAQVEKMKKSDSRIQSVTETMNVIRMLKLFGWESRTSMQLDEKRQDELKSVLKLGRLQLFNGVTNNLIPIATIIVTYGTYTVIMKEALTASKVFASMAIFEMIQVQFAEIFYLIPPVIQAKVSLDRMNEFLNDTELLDEFALDEKTPPLPEIVTAPEIEEGVIGIRQGSFTWTTDSDGTTSPSRRNFVLRIEEEVFFKRGCVNLVIGQTGSGKTSLLMALLGEMHYTPTGPNSVVRLPRSGGVAYHAQECWVLNESIRDNILFGSPFDEERYDTVIEQCGLKLDIALFSAGDQTEVGEKGLTLSGGQKARVTLARAVYSSAEILLLDDVLAALDVHTAKWIVEKCFKGELLRHRTVILVTHNIALTSPLADFVVALSSDGRILSQGSLSTALAKDKKLQVEVKKERQYLEDEVVGQPQIEDEKPVDKPSRQLVVEEEVAVGHLSWSAFQLYMSSMAGSAGPVVFWCSYLVCISLSRFFLQLGIWILGLWASDYENHAPRDVSVLHYLTLYSSTIAISFAAFALTFIIWVVGTIRASRHIHALLIDSVLGSTLRWLDKTPISRVITRCTQDIASIDNSFPRSLYHMFDLTLQVVLKFGAVIIISPIFSVPGIIMVVFGAFLGHVYMKAQLPVKRESSNAKSPVLAHFSSVIGGLVSIRAYGAQAAFRQESHARIDRFTRAQIIYWNLNRWIGIRSSLLAGLFAAGLATYLVYGPNHRDASTTGFSLTMAVGFSGMILWCVRLFNSAEVEGNSMERIQQYLNIEQEPKPSKTGEPPAYWPTSGELRVKGLSAWYSVDGPKVLHDLTFHIRSGERIGIVGRTGSGKSSLTLALLRCIITDGEMFFDGISSTSLNLGSLRSNITIIPQVPELLSGTLRQNLDPFTQHNDAYLNDALRSAGLFSIQSEDIGSRITLDTAISGGGSNLSVGQRQILALARAIVRRSKLLILDEATSAIDYETDNIIQSSLRSELDKEVTLLTVAHRLQTIMDYDRIMVLDSGRIVEFDKPSELLKREQGLLRVLVDESGDKDKLYEMAYGIGTMA